MDEVRILSPHGDLLTFSGRTPDDRSVLVESFTVSLELGDLRASTQVFAGYTSGHPTSFFRDMAAHWKGWSTELCWEGVEGELSMRATHDGHGQITLRIDLRPAAASQRWRVQAEFHLEPGQVDHLASQLALFFGAPQ
jgi:hypothetical protein